jgi:hypothetical protein
MTLANARRTQELRTRWVAASAAALLFFLGATSAQCEQRRHFPIYEALLFTGMPNFAGLGILPIRVVDAHELWTAGADSGAVPLDRDIRAIAAGGAGPAGMIVVDIENWDTTGPLATIRASREKYIQTLDRLRAAAPGIKFGLYSVLPDRVYWPAQKPRDSAEYLGWQKTNDAASPIVPHVDALFASLYTFYPDQEGWVHYAAENLREARRISQGKPVYCFLWPQYHDSASTPYALLDGGYWMTELETCGKLADGIVIWGGFRIEGPKFEPLAWDPDAPWWKATVEFARRRR